MMQANRVNEASVAIAVKAYLENAGGSATISQIRKALPLFLPLSPADRAPSLTRPGEQMWEQQVRNIVCHRDSEGNPVNSGKFRYSPRRLSLKNSPQLDLFDNDNDGE